MSETTRKKPKADLKLDVNLNLEQKEVVTNFYTSDVQIITGDFGTGKTVLSCYLALQALQKKLVDKIIFTRPVVKSRQEVLGYLPGSMDEKLKPFVDHIKYLLDKIYKPNLISSYIEKGKIVFLPLELTKGYNFDSTLLIVDEFQDSNYTDFRNIITRIGKDSKAIFTGSKEQIDDSMKSSCFHVLQRAKDRLPEGIYWKELKENHRNDKMFRFIKILDTCK